MSADIIQFISRPGNASEPTDFPTIALRSAVRDLASEDTDTAPCEYVVPEEGDT